MPSPKPRRMAHNTPGAGTSAMPRRPDVDDTAAAVSITRRLRPCRAPAGASTIAPRLATLGGSHVGGAVAATRTGLAVSHVTAEVLDGLALPEGRTLGHAEARRNIVTHGIDLNALVVRPMARGAWRA